ncbi:MAG: class I SAM-dependent methyltransferase [Anaerolineae bacterium]|nr:class I SAM-dependent methyltransferase [Anaerolineae bacterium]
MDGTSFYDDNDVFNTYMHSRQRTESPNDTIEKPVIMELIGAIQGRRILDLGCGDGVFGRESLANGCASYLGVEGSQNMVAVAQQTLAGTKGEVVLNTLENWDYPTAAFDLVVSRLVLHYIDNIDLLFANIHRTLLSGGQFVFSAEHPVITSTDKGWQKGTQRQDWVVDNYFDTSERVTNWMGGTVRKYHRTLEGYFKSVQQAGFVIERLREGHPQRENFLTDETYLRRKRIPLFLIMSLRKQ